MCKSKTVPSKSKAEKGRTGLRIYAYICTAVMLICFAGFAFVFVRAGYHTKVMAKLGLKEQTASVNYAVLAWENCLKKMKYDADIVFLGDSITAGSDFASCFPEKRIVNLGYSGDTLPGMINRLSMVQALQPEKVFVLGGINGLTDNNLSRTVTKYKELIEKLQVLMPEAKIYIQSVLPISGSREVSLTNFCHNETIVAFNAQLEQLAQDKGLVYIDLFSLYEKNGEMNPELTRDGVHLKAEAYDYWAHEIEQYVYE